MVSPVSRLVSELERSRLTACGHCIHESCQCGRSMGKLCTRGRSLGFVTAGRNCDNKSLSIFLSGSDDNDFPSRIGALLTKAGLITLMCIVQCHSVDITDSQLSVDGQRFVIHFYTTKKRRICFFLGERNRPDHLLQWLKYYDPPASNSTTLTSVIKFEILTTGPEYRD